LNLKTIKGGRTPWSIWNKNLSQEENAHQAKKKKVQKTPQSHRKREEYQRRSGVEHIYQGKRVRGEKNHEKGEKNWPEKKK